MTRATLAASIDQTLLKPVAGFGAGAEWLAASANAGFAAVCISPFLVPLASQILAGTSTKVCSVVAFPLGYSLTETKADEARALIGLGCQEIDMVMNIAAFLEGETRFVQEDIAAVVATVTEETHGAGIVKVILETGYLTPEQVAEASRTALAAGADYVKTSTGFGPRGASIEDVRIMRETVGERSGVKAAGGIRDLATARAMLDAGASRIGTSSGLEILAAWDAEGGV
ncbi:MAG: deoxyribose-phosphate aldolase [Actinomycetia bacterium]|nr:deoxyribose-phosphate aldolase [Actinomycetes bacterium]